MNFQELDKRVLEWNEIANGHRSKEERIITQIAQCQEEMVNEALNTIFTIEKQKTSDYGIDKDILIKLLDDYADSLFVHTEYGKLTGFKWSMYYELLELIEYYCLDFFNELTMIEACQRVIESNFTKFVPVDEMTQDQAIFEAGLISGRYNCNCVPEQVNGYWVFRDENGKIRKPSTFKPVYLEDLV